ncbi:VirE N-terminal domain-containing protein [Xylanibacter ruminicola]|uniref:VirE N-terminal domain-containing protein n=1 Tax=Xylanibacter ruminicola TaxID=839 RepID=A0A1M7I2G3_XYLRU|nr:BT4734/BF3469 family protein [Xylanibacter ruminicola]SFB76728.1 VirE N-terminal domain-containing protein [Xylanibacter ruminicola]SHM34944.1 VirE N-terminal domain-containing protein [Xylanibacter ruminicola]
MLQTTTNNFATCSNGLYEPMTEMTAEWFDGTTKCARTSELINAYRDTKKASKKSHLPVCCFQASFGLSINKKGVEGAWRESTAAHLTGLVVIDLDHVENPLEIIDRILGREDFSELGIMLIYITPSGNGIKIVFMARPEWGNLMDNQYEMAQLLGVLDSIDSGCKDAARASFVPKSDDVKFLDESLFTYSNSAYDEQYGHLYTQKPAKSGPTQQKWKDYEKQLRAKKKAEKAEKDSKAVDALLDRVFGKSQPATEANDELKSQPINEGNSSPVESTEPAYHGVPYSKIATALTNELGEPQTGDRHKTMMQMGNMLSVICDNDPKLLCTIMKGLPFVQQLIEERGLEEVERAMNYITQNSTYIYPSKELKQAMKTAGVKEPEKGSNDDLASVPLAEWADEIEALMPYYPCLREICQGVPRQVWPAAVFVGAAFFGTLMTRCYYHYWFKKNEKTRLNYSIYVIGAPGSGKSFAVRLDKLILAPIKQQSKQASEAINKYKQEAQERGTSSKAQEQDALKKPTQINRYMPPRTSNGVFIESMVNAKENVNGEEMNLHMVTFDSELTNSTKMQKGGGWIDKTAMELKAFHNEEDGQNYANEKSYNGIFQVYWNYVYTGTPDSLKEKVNARTFGSGLATRLATIPMPKPSFKLQDLGSAEDLDKADMIISEWANKLNTRYGELPLQKLSECTKEWYEHRAEIAEFNNEDYADLMLIQRVGYYGMNIPAPFIDMRHWDEREQNGTYEVDDIDQRFCRLILDIQYHCQHHFYGTLAYNYYDNQARDEAAYATNHTTRFAQCFKMLPDTFSKQEFAKTFDLANADSSSKQITTLINEKAIERVKRDCYKKLVANL